MKLGIVGTGNAGDAFVLAAVTRSSARLSGTSALRP